MLKILLAVLAIAATCALAAYSCPPRGYDTYDSVVEWRNEFINESTTLQQAAVLQQLNKAGGAWTMMVLDEGWADLRTQNGTFIWSLDQWGVPIPVESSFPSSAGGKGLAPLVQKLQAMGLDLGVWHCKGISKTAVEAKLPVKNAPRNCTADMIIMPDKKTCSWHKDMYYIDVDGPNGDCAQAYYNSVVDTWASWGITYIKLDCIFGSDLHQSEIVAASSAVRRAVAKYGRPITFSLSPGFLATTDLVRKTQLQNLSVNLYRVTDDLWDCWSPLSATLKLPQCLLSNVVATVTTLVYFQDFLDNTNSFGQKIRPDPDMVPVSQLRLGYNHFSRFTGKNLNFVIGLWTITLSPIILGGDLTKLQTATAEQPQLSNLLANPALAQMHCTGAKPRVIDWQPSDVLKLQLNGSVTWALGTSESVNSLPSRMNAYLGFFPFSLDPNDETPRISRLVTWTELGLMSSPRRVGDTQVPIPNIASYDVLHNKPGPTYDPTKTPGVVLTAETNDAAVWQFFVHE